MPDQLHKAGLHSLAMRDSLAMRAVVSCDGWLLVWVSLLFLSIDAPAWARCGGSERQLIWRFAPAAELIVWNHAYSPTVNDFNDVPGRSGFLSRSEYSDVDGKECTLCRCHRDDDRPASPAHHVSRSWTGLAYIDDDIGLVDHQQPPPETILADGMLFLSRSLGVLERPPKG